MKEKYFHSKNKAIHTTPTEEIEDEIFREAMQRLAEEERRRAIEENERLKNDPNFIVPESLRQKCMELLEKHYEG